MNYEYEINKIEIERIIKRLNDPKYSQRIMSKYDISYDKLIKDTPEQAAQEKNTYDYCCKVIETLGINLSELTPFELEYFVSANKVKAWYERKQQRESVFRVYKERKDRIDESVKNTEWMKEVDKAASEAEQNVYIRFRNVLVWLGRGLALFSVAALINVYLSGLVTFKLTIIAVVVYLSILSMMSLAFLLYPWYKETKELWFPFEFLLIFPAVLAILLFPRLISELLTFKQYKHIPRLVIRFNEFGNKWLGAQMVWKWTKKQTWRHIKKFVAKEKKDRKILKRIFANPSSTYLKKLYKKTGGYNNEFFEQLRSALLYFKTLNRLVKQLRKEGGGKIDNKTIIKRILADEKYLLFVEFAREAFLTVEYKTPWYKRWFFNIAVRLYKVPRRYHKIKPPKDKREAGTRWERMDSRRRELILKKREEEEERIKAKSKLKAMLGFKRHESRKRK